MLGLYGENIGPPSLCRRDRAATSYLNLTIFIYIYYIYYIYTYIYTYISNVSSSGYSTPWSSYMPHHPFLECFHGTPNITLTNTVRVPIFLVSECDFVNVALTKLCMFWYFSPMYYQFPFFKVRFGICLTVHVLKGGATGYCCV